VKPDLVQLPLHIYQPSIDVCKEVVDSGTKLIGKLVLPKNTVQVPKNHFADMFKKYNGLISIWDFGGEPETRPDQAGCRFGGSPKQFVDLMSAFYYTGKEIDPENTIGGCGWITPTFNGLLGNDDRSGFLRECLGYWIGDVLDFVSLNFYVYGYGGTKNIFVGMGKVNELLATWEVSKPIVVSEFGVPCSGDPAFYHIIQTPERQAVSLLEQNILFNSMGIDYSIWFALQYEGWGLVAESGEKRPSYHVMQTMMRMLKGSIYQKQIKALPSRSVEERWITDKVQWHVFNKGAQDVHVVWLTGGYSLVRKAPPGAIFYNMYGEELLNEVLVDTYPKYMVTDAGQVGQKDFMMR